jgi:hypothetical protein
MEGFSSIDALGMRSAVNTGEDEEKSDDDDYDEEEAACRRNEEEKKLTDERNKLIALVEEKVGE